VKVVKGAPAGVDQIDEGGVDAPGWLRERLVGAMLALDSA
jgi:hypothetical protein